MSSAEPTTTVAPGPAARRLGAADLGRRWLSILVVTLVGLLLGLAAAFATPASYRSSVTVLVNPTLGNSFSPTTSGQSLDTMSTEAAVVSSTPVAALVQKAVPSAGSVTHLEKQVVVTNATNSQVLKISYAAKSATQAQQVAAAFATSYLSYRQRTSVDATQAQLKTIQASMTTAQTQISAAVKTLAAAKPSSAKYAAASRRVQTASSSLSDLQTQADQLTFSQSVPGHVLSPASLPTGASGLPRFVFPVAGLIVGALLGLFLAWYRWLRDPRVYTSAALRDCGWQVIGPMRLTRRQTARGRRHVHDPTSAWGVATSLRNRLGPDPRAVLLTGMGADGGRVVASVALVEALRSQAIDAALLDLSGSLRDGEPGADSARDEGSDAGADEQGPDEEGAQDIVAAPLDGSYPSGVEHFVQRESGVPVYLAPHSRRFDGTDFRDLVDRVERVHELVVVVAPQLEATGTLDVFAKVPDTVLMVPLGKYDEQAIASAIEVVHLFRGRVVALLGEG